ncbi:mitochondrial import inner membrane translocase subunit Tim10 B isoform X1 [Neodiprion lecontei]|uniref:Mitochondrial import inner membrane translocase subunit n=1 Tax=Neodiprion lecontei TaxID=441921 RepID=A0A6J0BLC1_NEOLC|nr:mitochondrial import inner membrane translocase subunit Tim10 B isoform X1 [Neodiprion lecontei]
MCLTFAVEKSTELCLLSFSYLLKMLTQKIRTVSYFKDFLTLYNQISDTCFKRCTNTYNSRDMDVDEEACVNNCAQKHVKANTKMMKVYMEVLPVLMNKRTEEMNAAQAAAMAQQQQLQQDTQDTETSQNLRQSQPLV